MEIKVRPFRESDVMAVHTMLQRTEEVHVAGGTYSEKAVRGWPVTRAQDVILMAEVQGEVVGFISSKLNDPEPDCAYIDSLIVKLEYRGRGIGQSLLDQCISSLKSRGVIFVHLHVRTDFPRTINFWEKNNFKGKEPLLWMYKEI